MPRELLLLRHGKSDWNTDVDDFHRPLKDRGKRSAQRLGIWLIQEDSVPDFVVSSPAERALVTAQKICKTMGMTARDIHRDARIYGGELEDLLKVLADCPASAERVMLVGHNPGLEELLDYLASDEITVAEDGRLLPTATLARLRMPDDWSALDSACAELIGIQRPGSLPDKFPYPSPDGIEMRDRPAYYYTQSSVIPYRRGEDGTEFLVITSSNNKHWVVPKGIKDPGLTPQASAAKEAWEEAGIEGRVTEKSLGSYRYEKWGATCNVEVYAMEVTRVLSETEWRETHRGREWVSAEQAAERLKQPELKPMVQALARHLSTN